MQLGDVGNPGAADQGKPLDGVTVLALEQMQALPFATQLLARLGADVVKVEHPVTGDLGRGALPAISDPQGRRVGATFLRNNLNKRSVGIDLKADRGRALVLDLAERVDVVAENFKPGALERLGLGYDDFAARNPGVIHVSVTGFGTGPTAYSSWPAFAPTVEAMSGIYEYQRRGDDPPTVSPVGALGDIGTSLFATIGILAALRHRDRTGSGQHVDVAMYDSLLALTDIVTNYWSMGVHTKTAPPLINDGFRASDGWFVVQVGRRYQFERFAEIVGHPEWLLDDRLGSAPDWRAHLEDVIRPGVEGWAATRTKREAAQALAEQGVAAGPCHDAADVIADPHVAARHMLVEIPSGDADAPVLVPGNPIKFSNVTDGPDERMPWLGEHTDAVLRDLLGLGDDEIADLRAGGVIGTIDDTDRTG